MHVCSVLDYTNRKIDLSNATKEIMGRKIDEKVPWCKNLVVCSSEVVLDVALIS
jgi:hypothetical protein